jgi:CheY-like chemotaxis protein
MYGEILRLGGYRVIEALDGEAGLAAAFAQRPDIIIMDLCMPRLNGWEAIRRLKTDARTRSIPVVALTALTWHSPAIEVECEAYVVKPCLPLDLLGILESLLACAAAAAAP